MVTAAATRALFGDEARTTQIDEWLIDWGARHAAEETLELERRAPRDADVERAARAAAVAGASADAAKAALAARARRHALGALGAARRIGTREAEIDRGATRTLAVRAAPLDEARRAALDARAERGVHGAAFNAESAVALSRSIVGEYDDAPGGLDAGVAADSTEARGSSGNGRILGWGGTAEDRVDALRIGGGTAGASADCCTGNMRASELVGRMRCLRSRGERSQAMCGPGLERRGQPRSAHFELLHSRRKGMHALTVGVDGDDACADAEHEDEDWYTLAHAIADATAAPPPRTSSSPMSAGHIPARSSRSGKAHDSIAQKSGRHPQAKRTQGTPVRAQPGTMQRSQHSAYGSVAPTRRGGSNAHGRARSSAKNSSSEGTLIGAEIGSSFLFLGGDKWGQLRREERAARREADALRNGAHGTKEASLASFELARARVQRAGVLFG